jgi:hypothetical protein
MKLIFGLLIFFLIVLLLAIVIYNNSKTSKRTNQHAESIIQLHGGVTSLDKIINYCTNRYSDVSLIVVHHHNPIKVNNNYVIGSSRNQKLSSGFYVWMLPAHTILLNKNVYIIDDMQTLRQDTTGGAYLTKIKVSDIYFANIQRTFYIATLKFNDSYFNQSTYSDVASVFDFLHKESMDAHPILVADFATQNWNDLNRDWRFSSGEFRIVTHVDDRGCVGRHGFLFNTKLNGVIHVEHIFDINIESELLSRLVLKNHEEKSGSIKLGLDTEKTTMSTKYRDCVNYIHSKITPDKHNISISNFIEYVHKNTFKIVPVEDILNKIITKQKS